MYDYIWHAQPPSGMLAPPPHRRVGLHLHYVLRGISDVRTRIGLHGRLPAIILHPTPSHFLHRTGYSVGTCVQCIMNAVPQHSEGPYSEQRWVWGVGLVRMTLLDWLTS